MHSHSSAIDIVNPAKREQMYKEHLKFKNQFNETHATDFWACSNEAADWLFAEQIPRSQIKIMRNAIDVEAFTYNEMICNQYRKELGLEGKFVIGNTCRFEYQKNHEFLIRVFAHVHRKNPHAILLLVGGGQKLPAMKQMVKELDIENAVRFLGWREDIAQIYQAIDLFCLPSLFEGLPIVLVEAQAAGLKCIASSNVTREVKVTENLQYLELTESEWVDKICEFVGGYERKDYGRDLKHAGFDIRDQIKIIEAEYDK